MNLIDQIESEQLRSDIPEFSSGDTVVVGSLAVSSSDSTGVTLSVNGKGAMKIPVGGEGDKPAGSTGLIRYNTDSSTFEGYGGTAWGSLGGCLLYTSPSPRDGLLSRMPSYA